MLLYEYVPIFIFFVIGIVLGVAPLALSIIVAPRKIDEEKISPYECGFEPFENARIRIDIRFYLVAILFIIFDLEIAFLFPWSVVFTELSLLSFFSMLFFLVILILGFIYEWKKGALEWE